MMLARRAAAHAAAPASDRAAAYRDLIRTAEADLDAFFVTAGEKLTALLRELEGPGRPKTPGRS